MRLLLAALTLFFSGCAAPLAIPAAEPVLARADAERWALRADDLMRAAFAGAGAEQLASVFRGRALTEVRLQVARLIERGVRIEERGSSRRLVDFDPVAPATVLAVTAEYRLATADSGDPPWAATERQWWA